jgi:hypothetical protein
LPLLYSPIYQNQTIPILELYGHMDESIEKTNGVGDLHMAGALVLMF